MSQRCRANPCCREILCTGIPIPQDPSGIQAYATNSPYTEFKSVSDFKRLEERIALLENKLNELMRR